MDLFHLITMMDSNCIQLDYSITNVWHKVAVGMRERGVSLCNFENYAFI